MMGTVTDGDAHKILEPDAVRPLVAWLCHEDCDTTGGLFEVGAGWMARVRSERSPGAYFPPSAVSVDEVAGQWDRINDFTDATKPTTTADSMRAVIANPHLPKR